MTALFLTKTDTFQKSVYDYCKFQKKSYNKNKSYMSFKF